MSPVLSYKLNEPDRALLLEKGVETARVKGADVVWMQFAEEESEWFSLLSHENGAYCGTDLRLSLRLKPGSDEDSQETRLRPASREDLELLEKIAARGHRNSHFFRDPFLDEKKKERLFPEYLRKSFGSESRTLWVAEDGNELMGFTLLIEPTNQEESIGRRVGILDYIVVDPKFQGRGVGKALLKKSHNHLASKGFEFVELKTMLDNRSAVNFYQREGYRLVSSEVHFSLGM
ncbi:MAG: GNAT family N-acetyltransferase [Candidatus Omnitrophica bacterium]|nr:GNAT family N-acetyltransferase [Candidatus Omnitrophota bacterium]